MKFDLTRLVDHFIKQLFDGGHAFSLQAPPLICRHRVILRIFPQHPQHLRDDLGALLQIGVDNGDEISVRVLQTGIHRRLLAEVAGKAHKGDLVGILRMHLPQAIDRFVLAAVVDKHHIIVLRQVGKRRFHRLHERHDIVLLVIAGHHQRYFLRHIQNSFMS